MIYPNTVLFSAYDFARQLPDQYRNSAHSTLTVMTEGVGLKGPFKVLAVFERVVPDPYLPQS